MRPIKLAKLISVTLPLAFPGFSLAQGWIKYVDEAERFIVNFPREPDIREIDYISERGATFPARVYSVDDSESLYTVTVVDYTVAEKVHEERCTNPGYDCNGFEAGSDVRGSIAFAAWNFRQQSDAEVTYDAYAAVDGIQGHQLQITRVDGSRSFIGIHLHARRLYILYQQTGRHRGYFNNPWVSWTKTESGSDIDTTLMTIESACRRLMNGLV